MGNPLNSEQAVEIKTLTKAQIDEYKKVFSLFDTDNDGVITTKELGAVMRSLGQKPSDSDLRDIVKEVDTDNNGSVDFSEFLLVMTSKPKEINFEEEIRAAFEVFDLDKNGVISAVELRHVMNSLGEKLTDAEIDLIMSEVDHDRNGAIDFNEFLQVLMHKQ